jgi:hypothetical protein
MNRRVVTPPFASTCSICAAAIAHGRACIELDEQLVCLACAYKPPPARPNTQGARE